MGFAHEVDKAGRTILRRGQRDALESIQHQVTELTKDPTDFTRDRNYRSGPIKTLIIDRRIVGLQELAVGLIRWVNQARDAQNSVFFGKLMW